MPQLSSIAVAPMQKHDSVNDDSRHSVAAPVRSMQHCEAVVFSVGMEESKYDESIVDAASLPGFLPNLVQSRKTFGINCASNGVNHDKLCGGSKSPRFTSRQLLSVSLAQTAFLIDAMACGSDGTSTAVDLPPAQQQRASSAARALLLFWP